MSKEHIVVSKEVETSVLCDKCGAGLCRDSKWNIDTDTDQPYIEVVVYPCEKCITESYQDGVNEGSNE